jgi:hypothetical protein
MADRTDTYYAAEEAIHGYGAQLMVGDGASPEVFEAIAGVVSIEPGEMSTEDIDRTHLRSPVAHKEHMPGMRDSGAFTVRGIWLPEEQSQSNAGGGSGPFTDGGLVALWRGRLTYNFKIKIALPNLEGASPAPTLDWPFRGYVSRFQPGAISTTDKIDFTAEFRPGQAYDEELP